MTYDKNELISKGLLGHYSNKLHDEVMELQNLNFSNQEILEFLDEFRGILKNIKVDFES
jgi:hypothetical protein